MRREAGGVRTADDVTLIQVLKRAFVRSEREFFSPLLSVSGSPARLYWGNLAYGVYVQEAERAGAVPMPKNDQGISFAVEKYVIPGFAIP
ncbi:hypothetical protein NL676_039481 [Syzygium grande]|nr:hypothetical protein NL676_039481 [Syzygium grande]